MRQADATKTWAIWTVSACTGYPTAKRQEDTKSGMPAEPEVKLDEVCPQCGRKPGDQTGDLAHLRLFELSKCKYIKKETIGSIVEVRKGELTMKNAKRGGKSLRLQRISGCDL